jgi:predicted O-methyltransferase YrrM
MLSSSNKTKFQSKFPIIFKITKKAYFTVIAMKYPLDYLVFLYYILINKPYFGPVMFAGITCRTRKGFMEQTIARLVDKSKVKTLNILEVGSWAGGSAILLAKTLEKLNTKGLVFCVDSWIPFDNPDKDKGVSKEILLFMNKYLKNDKIFKLFNHNVRASGFEKVIKPLRGLSSEILPLLKKKSLNMVYIDASHIYSQVINDLKLADRLIIEGGFICGDDCEMQLHEVDREYAITQKEEDFIEDIKTKKLFHPGVALALDEFFSSEVSCYEGYWIMEKTASGWKQVLL